MRVASVIKEFFVSWEHQKVNSGISAAIDVRIEEGIYGGRDLPGGGWLKQFSQKREGAMRSRQRLHYEHPQYLEEHVSDVLCFISGILWPNKPVSAQFSNWLDSSGNKPSNLITGKFITLSPPSGFGAHKRNLQRPQLRGRKALGCESTDRQ